LGSIIIITGSTIGGQNQGNTRGGIILNGTAGQPLEVTIANNTISYNTQDAGQGGKGGVGIWLYLIDKVKIDNNSIFNNGTAGIVLVDVNTHVATGYEIKNNDIYNHAESAGINIGGASAITIGPGNEIYSNYAGIAFYVDLNPGQGYDDSHTASSGTVTIGGNDWGSRNFIYSNTKAGIAVIDRLTAGQINIQFNEIHSNTQAGIAFFNECTAVIEDNEIHTHAGAAGIFTGDWSGTLPPDDLGFDITNEPASLTIRRNKTHGNRAGMRLDHASGAVTNNLVYGNSRAGIRFSGSDTLDPPFPASTAPWGIADITNNTVADNGSAGIGGGIVYDDISATAGRNFFDSPQGTPPASLDVINNISAYNEKAGIRAGCTEANTVYNLLHANFGYTDCDATVINICAFQQLGGFCWPLPTGVIFDDPSFVDKDNNDYQLQVDSPAIDAGVPDDPAYDDEEDPGNPGYALAPSLGTVRNDMGCYGGPDPMTW
jgi:hypothetical protein